MNYFFSIVIPVYNAEKYISQMLDSILAQSYSNWELILIDDGSSDKSGDICDRYVSDKVKVYHYQNQGQTIARIEGIKKANGDYTYVVDADDYLNKDCLKIVNETLNRVDCDAVLFPYQWFNESSGKEGMADLPCKEGLLSTQELLDWVIKKYNHVLYTKVVKTSIMKDSLAEATRRRLVVNGDYSLIIPVVCRIKKPFFINISLYYYRVYDESISHKMSLQHIVDTDYVSSIVQDVLKCNHFDLRENLDSIFISYLHMISWMAEALIMNKGLNDYELNVIHALSFYDKSISYERRKYFSTKEYLILRSLRKRKKVNFILIREVIRIKRKLY